MLKVKFHTLATWCQEPTHWKGPWCWERLKAGGEGDEKGWDGCMASPSIDMSLSKFWEVIKDRKAWHAAVHGIAKSWTDLNKKNYVFLVAWFSNFTFYFLKYFLHVYILCMINWLLFGLSSTQRWFVSMSVKWSLLMTSLLKTWVPELRHFLRKGFILCYCGPGTTSAVFQSP